MDSNNPFRGTQNRCDTFQPKRIIPVRIANKRLFNLRHNVSTQQKHQELNYHQLPVRIVSPSNQRRSNNYQKPEIGQKKELRNVLEQAIEKEKSLILEADFRKMYVSDYAKKFSFSEQGRPHKRRFRSKNKFSKSRAVSKIALVFILGVFLASGSVFAFFYQEFNSQNSNNSEVAGAQEKVELIKDLEEYNVWVENQSGLILDPEEDFDQDDLSNYEEYLIGTSPVKSHTCEGELNDSQNLFNMINPIECQEFDLNNQEVVNRFSSVINLKGIQEEFLTEVVKKPDEEVATIVESDLQEQNNLLNLFEVESFQDLDSITIDSLQTEIDQKAVKQEYKETIDKIQQYILKHRSYEAKDRNYDAPVHPATYLQTSLDYQVPLKYVLAIARTESRFGTDRYTNSGNLTRPGKYKNIYSIGLDDSGGNIGFETWEEGVYAFGKWYQRFESRGVSDCNKWRIYNPNGDYCAKIEALANEVQHYLDN